MTDKQMKQFNQMLHTLKKIAKDYQTPGQLRRNSERQYGIDYEEAIGMSYENIQSEAAFAIKGVREIQPNRPSSNVVYPYQTNQP